MENDSLTSAGRSLFWPQVLFVEDLAEAFKIGVPAARKRLARGDFGPRFRSGRRWAVLKDTLLAHLAAQECEAEKPRTPPPVPWPNPKYLKLLKSRSRGTR